MSIIQAIAALILIVLAVVAIYRREHGYAAVFIVIAFLFANTIVQAEPLPRLTVSVVIDADILAHVDRDPSIDVNKELQHARTLMSEQLGLDVVVSIEGYGISPTPHTQVLFMLTDLVAYRMKSPKLLQTGVTLFLTERQLTIGANKYAGYTYMGSAYANEAVAVVRMDWDAFDYQTIAHELGHTLGMPHDGELACKDKSPMFGFIMQPYSNGSDFYSDCSVNEAERYIVNHKPDFYPQSATAVAALPDASGGGALSIWANAALLVLVIWQQFRVAYWRALADNLKRNYNERNAQFNAERIESGRAQREAAMLRGVIAERIRYELNKQIEAGHGVQS